MNKQQIKMSNDSSLARVKNNYYYYYYLSFFASGQFFNRPNFSVIVLIPRQGRILKSKTSHKC